MSGLPSGQPRGGAHAWAGWIGGSGEVEFWGGLTGIAHATRAQGTSHPSLGHPGETSLSPRRVFSSSLSLSLKKKIFFLRCRGAGGGWDPHNLKSTT